MSVKGTKIKKELTLQDLKEYFDTSLKFIFSEEHFDYKLQPDGIELYLHYPEIIVKNSKNQTQTIKDVFVKLYFQITDGRYSSIKGISMRQISFMRSTYTLKEYNANYLHSHVSTGKEQILRMHFTTSVCMGNSTPFSTMYTFLHDPEEFNIDALEQFILSIELYLSWESLEGGPYNGMYHLDGNRNRISNVSSYLNDNQVKTLMEHSDFKKSTEELLKLLKGKYELSIDVLNGYYEASLNKEGIKIVENFYKSLISHQPFMVYIVEGREYSKLGKEEELPRYDKETHFSLKDKKYFLSIIDERKPKEEKKDERQISSKVIRYLNGRKTKELYEKGIIETYGKHEEIQASAYRQAITASGILT